MIFVSGLMTVFLLAKFTRALDLFENSTAPAPALPEFEVITPNGFVYAIPFNAAHRKMRGTKPLANVTVTDQDRSKLGRVIGGQKVTEGELTYQVAMLLQGFGLYCSGSIYRTDVILTAAHCFYEDDKLIALDEIVVAAGKRALDRSEPLEELRTVREVVIHPEFNPEIASTYDLAIVRLAEPLCFNRFIQPIGISSMDYVPQGPAMVSGWGVTRPRSARDPMDGVTTKHLRKGSVVITSPARCLKAYRDAMIDGVEDIVSHESVICAGLADGSVDSCQGDSGGPLTCTDTNGKEILCGVISTGVGCGLPDLPSLYSNVGRYSNWILTIAGEPDLPCVP